MIVNDDLERMCEMAVMAKFKVQSLLLPGGIEENHDNYHSG
jgi:hypothetical protein